MTLVGLDHAILALHSLDSATALGRALGLEVTPGGEHPGKGTHNSIVRFELDYFELIAISSPDLARVDREGQALREHLESGEGWLGFALGSDDLSRDVAAVRARGLSVEDPADGARTRPDGVRLRWRTARIAGNPWGGRLPFLIQHETPVAERRTWAPPDGHPLGAARIAAVALATADLNELAGDYARLLGVAAPEPEEVPALPATRVAFTLGSLRLELLQPRVSTGGLAEFVRALPNGRDSSLFLVTLAVRDLGRAVDYLRAHGTAVGDPTPRGRAPLLDPAQTAGARFQLIQETLSGSPAAARLGGPPPSSYTPRD